MTQYLISNLYHIFQIFLNVFAMLINDYRYELILIGKLTINSIYVFITKRPQTFRAIMTILFFYEQFLYFVISILNSFLLAVWLVRTFYEIIISSFFRILGLNYILGILQHYIFCNFPKFGLNLGKIN